MLRSILPLLVAALAGCASLFPGRSGAESQAVVLCVENGGLNPVLVRAGEMRISVLPGRSECREMFSGGNPVRLRATARSGVGVVEFAETLQPSLGRCWNWVLGNSDASRLNFMPCDE